MYEKLKPIQVNQTKYLIYGGGMGHEIQSQQNSRLPMGQELGQMKLQT